MEAGRHLNARAAAGFAVDLIKPNRPPGKTCPLSAASQQSSPPMWRSSSRNQWKRWSWRLRSRPGLGPAL